MGLGGCQNIEIGGRRVAREDDERWGLRLACCDYVLGEADKGARVREQGGLALIRHAVWTEINVFRTILTATHVRLPVRFAPKPASKSAAMSMQLSISLTMPLCGLFCVDPALAADMASASSTSME